MLLLKKGETILLIVGTMAQEKKTVWISREWQNTYLTQTEATQRHCLPNSNVQALVRTRKGYAEQLRNLFAHERAPLHGVITLFRFIVPAFQSSR